MISLTELLNAEAAFTWAMDPNPISIEREKAEMANNLESIQLEWLKRNMKLTAKLDRIAAAFEKFNEITSGDVSTLAKLFEDEGENEEND